MTVTEFWPAMGTVKTPNLDSVAPREPLETRSSPVLLPPFKSQLDINDRTLFAVYSFIRNFIGWQLYLGRHLSSYCHPFLYVIVTTLTRTKISEMRESPHCFLRHESATASLLSRKARGRTRYREGILEDNSAGSSSNPLAPVAGRSDRKSISCPALTIRSSRPMNLECSLQGAGISRLQAYINPISPVAVVALAVASPYR
ncbi:unnamed protein product [Bemisia tabaci]|uniref:Uncharacterized protein n=1 Tax=Bemisia tabaci TaxID=7038 RepID=A0A9N9ZWF5_BEMTA|nr:unnamed protein product [Bemisia tabaci]